MLDNQDFITLACPNCGGKLQVTPDLERFACAHCGMEHIVRRAGGVVSLAPVAAAMGRVQAGVDRTASELAIKRLREEIQALEQRKFAMASSWHGLIYLLAWGAGILTLLSLLATWLVEWDASFICITFVLGLITAGLIVYEWDLNQNYLKRIAPVQAQINERQKEIKRQMQVVRQGREP